MGRKLRFNNKRNYERRRQQQHKNKVGRPCKNHEPFQEVQAEDTPRAQDHDCDQSTDSLTHKSITLSDFQDQLSLPLSWSHCYSDSKLSVYKMAQKRSTTSECPTVMTQCITVHEDLSWEVHIHNRKLDALNCPMLEPFSDVLTPDSLKLLLSVVHGAKICSGHPDSKFCDFIRGKKDKKLVGRSNQETAFLDSYAPVMCNDVTFEETVRSTKCTMLSATERCACCATSRAAIRSAHNRSHSKSSPHVHPSSRTNLKSLTTPLREKRVVGLRKKVKSASRKIKELEKKIDRITKQVGITVDSELEGELLSIMKDNTPKEPEGSFRQILWQQQLQVMKQKDARQRRWHPAIVRWCLHLKLISSSAYNAVASSGFLTLPSQRTLRDYTHFIKSEAGFKADVNAELRKEMKVDGLKEFERCVGIVFDEMKIKDKLVFDKNYGKVIGWVDLGEFDNEVNKLERDIDSGDVSSSTATHMLVFMIRGIVSSVEFPYAQFPTHNLNGGQLFTLVWDAVRNVESCDLIVKFLTADGVSMNRLVFKMCRPPGDKSNIVYRTLNPFSSKESYIYLISDIPHLIKTTRNCWSHSFAHGNTRALWNNGKFISWQHLIDLMRKSSFEAGLKFLPKIKDEHLHLTSFSRMRVYLAAQVLSTSVANAFDYFDDEATTETRKFVRYFDKFFDCCNTRCISEWYQKNKPDLKPYYTSTDERLEWLEKSFLGYLDDWEDSIRKREGFSPKEKAIMHLSNETLTGLRMSVNSIVALTRELLAMPGCKMVLTEKFCQDPLEEFFGKQRGAGGRCDNPTVQQFLHNTTSLRVQRSISLNPVYGNCRSRKAKRSLQSVSEVSEPLSKRKRNK